MRQAFELLGLPPRPETPASEPTQHHEIPYHAFDVAKDRNRPFVVGSGNRTITAVGTEFNVMRQSERVVVTVTEGKVKVAKQPPAGKVASRRVNRSHQSHSDEAFLIAGQQISYNEQAASITETPNTAVATAWREGNLQYLTEKKKRNVFLIVFSVKKC